MHTRTRSLSISMVAALAVALFSVTAAASSPPADGRPTPPEPSRAKPTVVLVHGAWADASGWRPVIERLQKAGYPVIAPANPLRSLAGDSAYLASILDQTPGPIVLVGHSYGGAVITNAAAGNPRVEALVYISAFIPDVGEDILHLGGAGSQVPTSIEFKGVPPFGEQDADIYITQSTFRATFAADLSRDDAAVMAATQRPIAAAAAGSPTTATAWKTIPSWSLISTNDKAIDPAQQRVMSQRANATITEVPTSHVPMLSRPDAVVRMIIDR